ncbi:MAG: hypothetical protein QT08_C0009G0065 [archaeon GW2011_AR17]|nr:MAG: hypothetical protein QT08_C0009G0065 [archaeon GW2011_AR17]MBS3154143.1 HAD-IA family hydrolase [Candidatus Woesearchaeota archaeon]HIH14818.1 HAD-IA family hydrolase [Nanoarchaeota archaeon]HIH59029.1 HAD-IA family hydrolase [Nanoarchaeota archaeon]HII14417.1 HAD-IA family hydrolase [Nanoarchaeota archaeon]
MTLYELIIFDMDGTLYKFDSSGRDDAIFESGFYKEIERRGIDFIMKKLSVSISEAQKIREDIFRNYNGDVSIGLEKEYSLARGGYFGFVWNVDPSKYINVDKGLRELMRSIPYRRALLTTAPEVWARNVLRQLNIEYQFDGLWFGDGDVRKPDRRAYLQVTDSLGVMPEKTVIVEDEPKYLKPAKELGMTTVLVGSETAPWIDYYIPNIYEIQKIIRGR